MSSVVTDATGVNLETGNFPMGTFLSVGGYRAGAPASALNEQPPCAAWRPERRESVSEQY
jgi:hypothetical protein